MANNLDCFNDLIIMTAFFLLLKLDIFVECKRADFTSHFVSQKNENDIYSSLKFQMRVFYYSLQS